MTTLAGLNQLLSEFDARQRKVLLNGTFATQVVLSASAAADGVPGDCVCVAEQGPVPPAAPTVTLALASPLAAAGHILGVLIDPVPRGGSGYCALLGLLPPGTTGLGAVQGLVRVNTATGRCQRVASFAEGDFPVGSVDAQGNLTLGPSPPGPAPGGGGTCFIVSKARVTVAHSPAQTGQTTVETTVALSGALVGDVVSISPTANMPAGFALSHARISAADTLAVGISRLPVASGSAGSVTYDVTIARAP